VEILEKKYRRNDSFIFRKIAGENILVPVEQEIVDFQSIFTLNETGAFIWEKLGESNTLSKLKDDVSEQFDITSSQAERDLEDFIAQLQTINALIETK
jgi:hypothetical protein